MRYCLSLIDAAGETVKTFDLPDKVLEALADETVDIVLTFYGWDPLSGSYSVSSKEGELQTREEGSDPDFGVGSVGIKLSGLVDCPDHPGFLPHMSHMERVNKGYIR